MLDFTPVRKKEKTMDQLVANLAPKDLRTLTNEMIDAMIAMIANCTDADVAFVPNDPTANDTFATVEEEKNIAWTLGHVVVHTTASSEEAAGIAAELARGVPHRGGRSRSEIPWRTATTIAQCRHRFEESRRMRLASLDMWPDQPYLDNTYLPPREGATPVNAMIRFVNGLSHDDSHLGQIVEIVRQAKAARN